MTFGLSPSESAGSRSLGRLVGRLELHAASETSSLSSEKQCTIFIRRGVLVLRLIASQPIELRRTDARDRGGKPVYVVFPKRGNRRPSGGGQ